MPVWGAKGISWSQLWLTDGDSAALLSWRVRRWKFIYEIKTFSQYSCNLLESVKYKMYVRGQIKCCVLFFTYKKESIHSVKN